MNGSSTLHLSTQTLGLLYAQILIKRLNIVDHILFDVGFTFTVSFFSLFILRKIAKTIGLVDKPNQRKMHQGSIPLVGGISVCVSILAFLFVNSSIFPHTGLFAFCIIVLMVVGALDDKFDISFKIRLTIQTFLSIVMMVFGDLQLSNIGNILGAGDMLTLGWLGYVVTVLAVVGAINAFNMVDGIDGLLGGLSIVTLGSLGILLFHDGQTNIAYFCLILVVAILPYVLFNLGTFGRQRKVFMGDAGSMIIGFTVVWLLLLSSQNGTAPPLTPVTALWLIAIPLMDMTTTMIRRIRKGQSPFKPDREHLHHIFQRLGMTSSQTLIVICFIAACYAGMGIASEMIGVPEHIMFYAFMTCFVLYFTLMSNIWRISSWLKAQRSHTYKEAVTEESL